MLHTFSEILYNFIKLLDFFPSLRNFTQLPRFVLHASISGYLVFWRFWKRKKWTQIYLHASMSGYTCMQLWDMQLQDFQNVEFCLKNWLKCVPFNLYLYKWPKTNHYLSNKPIILESKVFGCRSAIYSQSVPHS